MRRRLSNSKITLRPLPPHEVHTRMRSDLSGGKNRFNEATENQFPKSTEQRRKRFYFFGGWSTLPLVTKCNSARWVDGQEVVQINQRSVYQNRTQRGEFCCCEQSPHNPNESNLAGKNAGGRCRFYAASVVSCQSSVFSSPSSVLRLLSSVFPPLATGLPRTASRPTRLLLLTTSPEIT